MKSTIFFLSIIFICNTSAQITFEKYYETLNDSRSNAVLQTSDNHYLLAGYIDISSSEHDVYLIKTNAYGDTVWTRTYPRMWTEYPEVILETADNNYLLAGHAVTRTGPSVMDVLLMKIAPDGDLIWTKTIGVRDDDEQIYDMRPTSDGGYILCGQYDESYTDIYYYLLKINANGDSLWSATYNPADGDRARGRAVVVSDDNKFVIAGYFKRGDDNFAHLAKIDSAGQAVWSQTWSNGESNYLNDIQETVDNGYILAGNTFRSEAGYMDFYLIKTDDEGDSVWARTYGGESSEFCYAVEQTADEGFIMAGFGSSFGHGSDDFYLVRTDSIGDTLWTRSIGSWNPDQAYDMQITSDGGIILTGSTYFGIGLNSFLVKTDSEGLLSDIFEQNISHPRAYYLYQNYPNPFNPTTKINYELRITNYVDLSIYNLIGQKVATLVSGKQQAGFYQVEWDASGFASGVYYYRLSTDAGFVRTRKLVLLR
jgi:hypothetical protein